MRAGLLLALLVGPLVVLLVQLSLRRGTAAALAAAGGIWLSDALILAAWHLGMERTGALLQRPYVTEVVGTVGVVVLVATGTVMWFRRPPDLDRPVVSRRRRGVLGALAQGFAVNTFNPFTVFFWSAFVLTQVQDRGLPAGAALAVYGGVLGTIVLTDLLKVLGARRLRRWLTARVARRVQRAGGVALVVFGLVLGLRVWLA